MKQKFFTNTIQSNFIKNLISNTALPLYDSVRVGDYLIEGFSYIYKTYLIKCTKSGLLGVSKKYLLGDVNRDGVLNEDDVNLIFAYLVDNSIFDAEQKLLADVNQDGNITSSDATKLQQAIAGTAQIEPQYICVQESAEFKVLNSEFYFGKQYLKYTELVESNDIAYDSTTHRRLGEYLRFYRDIFDTNLMPFYNCFTGIYTSKFYIDVDSRLIKQTNYDYYQSGDTEFNNKYHKKDNFKILQVPIKFNKDYTIAIDCNSEVLMAPCFIKNGQMIITTYGGYKVNLTHEYTNIYNSIRNYPNIFFKQPKVVNIVNNDSTPLMDLYATSGMVLPTELNSLTVEKLFQCYEKDLYLLIQIPNDNNSSVVVLEGDYSQLDTNQIINIECLDNEDMKSPSNEELDNICISNLSLLQLSDDTRYPFADRLIEYLLWNTIDNTETIGNNVSTIQRYLSVNLDKHVKGDFDNYLRVALYYYFKDSKYYTDNDILGYVDKDVEHFIYR